MRSSILAFGHADRAAVGGVRPGSCGICDHEGARATRSTAALYDRTAWIAAPAHRRAAPVIRVTPLAEAAGARSASRQHRVLSVADEVFYVPQPIVAPVPQPEVPRKRVERPLPGRLVLDRSSTPAHVYVDGYYAGAPEDFGMTLMSTRWGPAASSPPPRAIVGNIPPKDAHLPATCDQSRAVTWRP